MQGSHAVSSINLTLASHTLYERQNEDLVQPEPHPMFMRDRLHIIWLRVTARCLTLTRARSRERARSDWALVKVTRCLVALSTIYCRRFPAVEL